MNSQQMKANDDGSQNDTTCLTADAIRRIGRDIKDILKEPHENIVYIHSTTKVNVGYAMVVGTRDSPYFCVPMFYRIEFPEDYPHAPPKMKFLTQSAPNGTYVRMHPNYYVNGKCCLSILNSWSGEKWTGCQTLRSLLMTVLMTLTEDPLTNEPGYSTHKDIHDKYRAAVTEAGVNWISKFVSGSCRHSVRFCEDDTENNSLVESFKTEFVNKFAKDEDYGLAVLRMLNDYGDEGGSNLYREFVKPHDLASHYVSCYRGEYPINFERVRANAIETIGKVTATKEAKHKLKRKTSSKSKPETVAEVASTSAK
jgi:ubiquitin-protein ligase